MTAPAAQDPSLRRVRPEPGAKASRPAHGLVLGPAVSRLFPSREIQRDGSFVSFQFRRPLAGGFFHLAFENAGYPAPVHRPRFFPIHPTQPVKTVRRTVPVSAVKTKDTKAPFPCILATPIIVSSALLEPGLAGKGWEVSKVGLRGHSIY